LRERIRAWNADRNNRSRKIDWLSSVNYPSLSATIILPLGQRNITIIAVSLFFLVLFLCEIVCVPVISVTSRVTLIRRRACLRATRSAWPFEPAPCGSWGC
jgi:hypothetical protein